MKQRMTLYMNPDTIDRLTLVANYRKGAKSAIVAEALERYLNPERQRLLDDAALRRLDTISKSISTVARDGAIATETLSLFVRYFLTITPPLPLPEQESARAVGRQRFELFVAQVGRRLASDRRLVSEVLESIATHNPDLFGSALDDAPPKAAAPTAASTPESAKANGATLPPAETGHV